MIVSIVVILDDIMCVFFLRQGCPNFLKSGSQTINAGPSEKWFQARFEPKAV